MLEETPEYKDKLMTCKHQKLNRKSLKHFYSPLTKNSSIKACISRYMLLLQNIFGGFRIIKRNYRSNKQFKFLIDPTHIELKPYLEEKVDADSIRHLYELYITKSDKDLTVLKKVSENEGVYSQEFLLSVLSLWYNGKKGDVFNMCDMIYKRCSYSLENNIFLNIDILSNSIKNNVKDNCEKFNIAHLNEFNKKDSYLCLNIVEVYFILFINYGDVKLNFETYNSVTLHQILVQNYFCCFTPVKGNNNFNNTLNLSLLNIPLINLPENYKNIYHVYKTLRHVNTYTTEIEYFLRILSGCLLSHSPNKTTISNGISAPYYVPNIRILNYLYVFSYRLLLKSNILFDNTLDQDIVISNALEEFFQFLKYFILQSLMSCIDFNAFIIVTDMWILWTNPFKYYDNVSTSQRQEYTIKVISLYIYGYRIILDNILKLNDYKEKILIYSKILNNYETEYFQTQQTIGTSLSLSDSQFQLSYDIIDLYGYENLKFQQIRSGILHKLGICYGKFKEETAAISNLNEDNEDLRKNSDNTILKFESILKKWNGGEYTNNTSFFQYYQDKQNNENPYSEVNSDVIRDLIYTKSYTDITFDSIKASLIRNQPCLESITQRICTLIRNSMKNETCYSITLRKAYFLQYIKWKAGYNLESEGKNPLEIYVCNEKLRSSYYILCLLGSILLFFIVSSKEYIFIMISLLFITLLSINFSVKI